MWDCSFFHAGFGYWQAKHGVTGKVGGPPPSSGPGSEDCDESTESDSSSDVPHLPDCQVHILPLIIFYTTLSKSQLLLQIKIVLSKGSSIIDLTV